MSVSNITKEAAAVCFRGTRNILGECICDAGFTHDFTLMRYANCSSPVGWFEAFMSTGLVLSIITILFGANGFKPSKGKVRELLILFLISAVFAMIGFIASLWKGHVGREAWVFFGGFVVFMGIGYSRFVFLFLEVNYSFAGKKMFWRNALVGFLCLNAFLVGVNVGIILPILVLSLGDEYSPTYDVATYNLAVRLSLCIFPVHLFAIVPIAYVVTSDIVRKLKEMTAMDTNEQHNHHNNKNEAVAVNNHQNMDEQRAGSSRPQVDIGDTLRKKLDNAKKRLIIFRVINILILPPFEFIFMTLIYGVLLTWPQYVYIAPYVNGLFLLSLPTIPLSEIYVLTQTGFIKEKDEGGKSNISSKKDDSTANRVLSGVKSSTRVMVVATPAGSTHYG